MSVLAGIDEDVRFNHGAADSLARACRNAATAIDNQAGDRASWVTHGLTDFEGYYADLFEQNGTTQAGDATRLASALRDVATKVDHLADCATAEQERRTTARAWKQRQDERGFWDHVSDWFTGGEDPPVGGPDPVAPQSVPAPAAPNRQPLEGSGSTGTSSARPANLRTFASNSAGANEELAWRPGSIEGYLDSFVSGCGWGSLDASGVVTAFRQYLTANGEDVRWANTVAAAFEEAGDGVVTLPNASITASLQAAGVDGTRTDLAIDPPQAYGAPPTTGYANDPVNTATGNFLEPEVDLGFAGGAATLSFPRMYNSVDPGVGAFGPGWSALTEAGLAVDADGAQWRHGDGRVVLFPRLADGWDRATTEAYWLTADAEGHTVRDNAGGRWVFDAAGHLSSVDRGPGTRVDLSWEAGRLVRLAHERGRWIALTWGGDRVAALDASDGRRTEYGYDDAGRLVSVDGPGGRRTYRWNKAGLVDQVVDADGVAEATNTYDDAGRVVAQVSAHGRTTQFSYLPGRVTVVADPDGSRPNTWIHDARGRLVGLVDAHGQRQSTSFDRHGNAVIVTGRDGGVTLAEYDERGRCTTRVLPSGARVDQRWDEADRVVEVTVDPGGDPSTTRYGYVGDDRNPSEVHDPEGGVTRLRWHGNLLAELVDPTGVRVGYAHDDHGDLVATTNALGETARLERDAAGRVVAATTPLGNRTTFTYDDRGVLLSRTDPDGGTWRFEHSAAGRLTATIDPYGARTSVELDAAGEAVATTDPLGRTIRRSFDALGNLAEVRLPDGSTWAYAHDALARLVAITDPDGQTWRQEHDVNGTPVTEPTTRVAAADAPDTPDDVVVTDRIGRIISVPTPDGGSTLSRYDRCGRPVEYVDAAGGVTTLARDAAGRVVRLRRPDGTTTSYAYGPTGRLVELSHEGGLTTTFTYDADGRLVREGAEGDGSVYAWDACGRLTALTLPGKGTSRWRFDLAGRVVEARDPLWGTRRFAYDAAGQLVAATNALGGTTHYAYDDLGRVVETTDPLGHTTRRRFNAHNRVVEHTDAQGRTTTAGYDHAGRQTWQQNPTGERLTWTYDGTGQLVATGVDDRTTATFERDPRARRLVVEDLGVPERPLRHELAWDAHGRLTSRSRDGSVVRWTYDEAGRCTGMTRPDGSSVHYEHDRGGRLVAVDAGGLGRVTFTRDARGRLLATEGPDHTETWQREGGRVVRHTLRHGGVTSTTTIERTPEGRVAAIERDGVRTRYEHDAADQLVRADSDAEVRTWTYDPAGRLVAESDASGTTTHTRDAAGQLVESRRGQAVVTHEYDAFGRRTRTVTPDGTTDYAWHPLGWLSAVTDGRGTHTLHVDALGELARVNDADLFWDTAAAPAHPLQVGSAGVLAVDGATATPDGWAAPGWRQGRADAADPWGTRALADIAPGVSLDATGTLAVAGLDWLGARAYDPATRGFLSVDPLPAVAGAAWAHDPYNYAGNDPLHAVDPSGLRPVTDAELQAYRDSNNGAFAAVGDWVSNNWEYLAGGAMVIAGGVLVATGVGGPLGGMLIGAGVDTIIQKATTGSVDWGQVAVGAVVGLIPMGGVATRLGLSGLRGAAVTGAASGALGGFATGNYTYFTGPGPHTLGNYASTVGWSTVGGTVTGSATGAGTHALSGMRTPPLGTPDAPPPPTGLRTPALGDQSALPDFPDPYAGVREASEYLQSIGVPREYRVQVLQSMDVETIRVNTADGDTFGLRHWGGDSAAQGRYLMPTLPGTRSDLALPPGNTMEHLAQFQIPEGTTYLSGRVAPNFGYPGGGNQMYVNDPNVLVPQQ